ncbi:protein kinase domain [Coleofasciculus chthonoplastes PCC 7420]|uniref:non-specific serine/threonine protein kinase n=2 Tax=Coleofasciculaceae TaxID=1892251 RepID=B4VXJ7_9CYAN|nr:protein kinase domain [Coleofasciculus chthonoplastes PCC 7420]
MIIAMNSIIQNSNNNYPEFFQQGYHIQRELGHNRSSGRVTYLATHHSTEQSVVIKQFQFAKTGANWSDFDAHEREITLLQQLDCPSIPQYLDAFETPDGFCLIQEYKQAPSLAVPQSFTPEEVKQIAIALLEVLVYLQQQVPPIIHRDIKPENILVERSPQIKVYLVDFGLARAFGDDLAASSVVKGTLGFMPPEQMFNRQLTEASDLYGLGVTLICLLTQTKSADIGNLMDEDCRINYKSLVSGLNPQFITWLDKMVAPKLRDRFPNAATALAELLPIDGVGNSPTSDQFQLLQSGITPMLVLKLGVLAVMGTGFAIASRITNPVRLVETRHGASLPEIQQLQQTGECAGCNLSGADLREMDLRTVDLREANLSEANLQGANLQSANLENANLREANLIDADLKGAYLRNADLTAANLTDTQLESTDLRGAIMPGNFTP